MTEIIFNDIPSIVVEKNRVSSKITKNKWAISEYETGAIKGKMVYALNNMKPKPITLDFNVSGLWDVYLGSINMGGDSTATYSFTNGFGKFPIRTFGWMSYLPTEWIEENYFKTIDFTNNKLVLSVETSLGRRASLCYVRLVKKESNVQVDKNIMYHYDCDYYREEKYNSIDDMVERVRMLEDSGAEILIHETNCFGNVLLGKEKRNYLDKKYIQKSVELFNKRNEIDKKIIDVSQKLNIKLYAGIRLQVGNFCTICSPNIKVQCFDEFENDNREYSVKTRLGNDCGMLSYAYKPVRAYVINTIVEEAKKGWDGISLFFQRGTFIGFEKPVNDRTIEKYGVEAKRLPRSDIRLQEALCYFMTLFMSELNDALKTNINHKIDINVITLYGSKESKEFGFDIKEWAEKGLVDSVSQGLMAFSEKLGDSINKDGLIDLDKYEKELKNDFTIWRDIPYSQERTLNGAKEYIEDLKGTKTVFYATLGWERDEPSNVSQSIDKLKQLGIVKFISWNSNHKTKHLHILNFERYYVNGILDLYNERKVKYRRVLSLDGTNISENTPDWRG